ncbi:hypothetical protein MCAMS1_01054 [biofilm metagenome]
MQDMTFTCKVPMYFCLAQGATHNATYAYPALYFFGLRPCAVICLIFDNNWVIFENLCRLLAFICKVFGK